MKRAHIPEARWCLEWPRDVFICHEDIWTYVRVHENILTKGFFGLTGHIQMLTPGILTFLHLNMSSYLVSSPFLERRTWMTMSLQHGLSSERSKNYSSSIRKNILLCTAPTCHTNWARVFQVVLHSVVVYYKSKVRPTESIYKWVSV